MVKQNKNKGGLDPIRALILAQAEEHQLPLKALSKALGRNDAYMHQFIWRQSPKRLPEEARGAIAAILHIPEEALKTGRVSDETIRLMSVATPKPLLPASITDPTQTATAKRREGLVPVYECPGPINDAAATEWVERPGLYAGMGAGFAVWVAEAVGRLRPGDLVFVRPAQPASPGDAVVIAQGERLVAIGELGERGEKAVSVRSAAGDKSYGLPKHSVLKIAAAVFR